MPELGDIWMLLLKPRKSSLLLLCLRAQQWVVWACGLLLCNKYGFQLWKPECHLQGWKWWSHNDVCPGETWKRGGNQTLECFGSIQRGMYAEKVWMTIKFPKETPEGKREEKREKEGYAIMPGKYVIRNQTKADWRKQRDEGEVNWSIAERRFY